MIYRVNEQQSMYNIEPEKMMTYKTPLSLNLITTKKHAPLPAAFFPTRCC